MIPSAPPLVLRGHQGAVYDLAWHESAGCWISAGGDGVLAAWKHGKDHGKALAHHSSPFYALTLWKGIVVGGNSTGELVMHTPEGPRIMHVHKAPVFALFADQDEVLWSGDGQGNLCRWEWQPAGAVVTHQWPTDLGKIRHIAAHPSGTMATGSAGGWMVVNRHFECSTPVLAHDRSCYWALHLPSKQAILSGGQDGQLKVHRNDAQVVALDVHQSAIYRGVLQGNVLWTCGRDRDVKAWDLSSLDALGKLPRPHARSVNAMVVGGPDAAFLATGGDDRTVKIWAL